MNPQLHIGACSWKFEAWRGLVYSGEPSGYLAHASGTRLARRQLSSRCADQRCVCSPDRDVSL